jgi:bifunctional DNase/RNase
MTHDLLLSLLEALDAKVSKVVICDLRESTFFALVHLIQGDKLLTVDARPSDALALALRASAPIYVLRDVLERARAADLAAESADDERLKKWLEEISPEDLGKYTM